MLVIWTYEAPLSAECEIDTEKRAQADAYRQLSSFLLNK